MVRDDSPPPIPENDEEITLRDVLRHMQHGFTRLEGKVDANTKGIEANAKAIEKNRLAVDKLRNDLTARIDALEEDLTATIRDTVQIRRHVGMPVADE